MTEQLYYRETGKSDFTAQVVDVTREENTWRVVLDHTYFYPGGGGQPADKGWLNHIPVTDVRKHGDTIYHFLPENPGQGTVTGRIDWHWRKDFMQQHTGQHIISGALWKIGQYKTLSVHMGTDYTTIEIDAPDIGEHDVIAVETLANQIILDDLPVSALETDHRDIAQYPLRKPTAHQGKIRLVKIGEFDCVGCGGLHLDRTGQVRLVKATGREKIRDHARITWKIGDRALDDYRKKDQIISLLKPLLATNEDMFVQKVKDLGEELSTCKRKYSMRESQLAEIMTRQLVDSAAQNTGSGCRVVTAVWKAEEDNLIKKIIKILLKLPTTVICLVNITEGKLQWSIGSSQDTSFPFDQYKDELLAAIEGKGGGRSPLWQGTGSNPRGVDDFLSSFRTRCGVPIKV